MQIKNDIQVDSLKQHLIMDLDLQGQKKMEKQEPMLKTSKEPMLKTLTEHYFFTENEIRISEKIRDTLFGVLNCNPIIATHKANSSIALQTQKQYLVLTYPKRGINMMEVLSVFDKTNRFFYEFLLNIHNTFLDLLAVSERNFVFIDFSYNNMYFTKHTHVPYLCHFEKCLSLDEDDSEKNMLIFKKTLEQMTYFGNKHVILFILHKMREKKDLDLTDLNINILIREYVDQLYFIRFFSPEVKEEYRMKCEAYVKNHVMDVLNSDDCFGCLLSFKHKHHKHFFREMENFKLNSFFLNMLILMVPQKKETMINGFFETMINGFFNNLCYPFDTITHVSLLLIDSVKEFDHMDENILDTFYSNVNEKKNLF